MGGGVGCKLYVELTSVEDSSKSVEEISVLVNLALMKVKKAEIVSLQLDQVWHKKSLTVLSPFGVCFGV